MRWRTFLLAALGALTTLLGAGCGTTVVRTVTQTPTTTTTSSPAPSEAPDTPSPQQSPTEAKIGSTLSLSGFGGVKMDVTVTDFLDPATGGDFDEPSPGARFVGVKLELKNAGQTAYDDSPSNGAALISDTNEEADPEITVGGTCDSPADVKIAPGDTRNICIPFELPNAQKGMKFQFTLDSGFADDTGEWSLEGAPTSGSTPKGSLMACDQNISVNSMTSCPFAQNVFAAYAQSYKTNGPQASTTVSAHSPVTNQTYSMTCTSDGATVTCTGGNNALVTFPISAAQNY